jgi:acetate CoA/acetoacetate CoA-transferase beta subunit
VSWNKTPKEIIAERAAKEMKNGDVVNLGIGLPTLIPNYLSDQVSLIIQSENGFVGMGPVKEGETDPYLVDAGGNPAGIVPGAAMFDSSFSFSLIRGGHIDVTVLGALEVDEQGNLANWMVPGKMVPGMGGAMDLVTGAKKVIIAMEHCTKKGQPKILKNCTLPLTGEGVVDLIITELGVFSVTENGLRLEELQPGVDLNTVRAKTEASFQISENILQPVIS